MVPDRCPREAELSMNSTKNIRGRFVLLRVASLRPKRTIARQANRDASLSQIPGEGRAQQPPPPLYSEPPDLGAARVWGEVALLRPAVHGLM